MERQSITSYVKMVFKTCCYCLDLRVGVIAIAVLEIVVAIGCIAYLPIWYVALSAVCGVMVSGCLLFGAIKYHQTTIKICLILSMIAIVFYGIVGTFLVVASGTSGAGIGCTVADCDEETMTQQTVSTDAVGTAFKTKGAILIIGALINVFFWLCVFSFLKELQSGTSQGG